jgi:hypothetical protein
MVAGEATVEQLDELVAYEVARRATVDSASRAHGREPADLLAAVAPRRGIERLLDLSLRSGPYGDGFGTYSDGLTLARLEAAPSGIDLGALQPRLPEVLRTPSGLIDLVPEQLTSEATRLAEALARSAACDGLVLVGRRQLRTNNSWLRTIDRLAGGTSRCTLQIHPNDAQARGLVDGAPARLSSAVGCVEVIVEVTDAVSEGVVTLPHGWSQVPEGTWGPVARQHPGSNANALTPSTGLDALAGTAVLNAIPVDVERLPAATQEVAAGQLAG